MKQIMFLEKNKLDISDVSVSITASEGQAFVNFMRNRTNTSAWITSGTADANNTTLEIDFANQVDLNFIALVIHNFKSYKIEYWDGALWQNFSTPVDVTNNTEKTTHHEFSIVTTTKIKVTIRATIIADDDKVLHQLIATEKVLNGRLEGWPTISKPTVSRQKIRTKTISGKESIKEQIGYFSCTLGIKVYSNSNDLALFEKLYTTSNGFLVWLCGGDEDQFSSKRIGYRKEDFFLMKCADEYQPEWYKGLYKSGLSVNVDLQEVID